MGKEQEAYKIRKVSDLDIEKEGFWNTIQSLRIQEYPWDKEDFRVYTEVRLVYTDTKLAVQFKVKESVIKADYLQINDPVYKDSCVEFFFNPDPLHDRRYMNLECNALGVFLLQIGETRADRCYITGYDSEFFNIKTSLNRENRTRYENEYWQVEYSIPFHFLETYYGKLQRVAGNWITGNFYKCGDETEHPHYGCSYPISNPVPDFHKPEYFSQMFYE